MGLFKRFESKTEPIEDLSGINPDEPAKRITGKIIKLSERGFGFITSKEIPFRKIFFHWTALNQETLSFEQLRTGDVVEFEIITVAREGTSSLRAIRIKVLGDVK